MVLFLIFDEIHHRLYITRTFVIVVLLLNFKSTQLQYFDLIHALQQFQANENIFQDLIILKKVVNLFARMMSYCSHKFEFLLRRLNILSQLNN